MFTLVLTMHSLVTIGCRQGIGTFSEHDIARWVDSLPGLMGLGYGHALRKEGFCTSQSITLLSTEVAANMGIKLGHALQISAAAQARFGFDKGRTLDVPAGTAGLSLIEHHTMDNKGKLELIVDSAGEAGYPSHLGGSPFRCRVMLFPKVSRLLWFSLQPHY